MAGQPRLCSRRSAWTWTPQLPLDFPSPQVRRAAVMYRTLAGGEALIRARVRVNVAHRIKNCGSIFAGVVKQRFERAEAASRRRQVAARDKRRPDLAAHGEAGVTVLVGQLSNPTSGTRELRHQRDAELGANNHLYRTIMTGRRRRAVPQIDADMRCVREVLAARCACRRQQGGRTSRSDIGLLHDEGRRGAPLPASGVAGGEQETCSSTDPPGEEVLGKGRGTLANTARGSDFECSVRRDSS